MLVYEHGAFLDTFRFVGLYKKVCTGKFAPSESTVSKFGKIFIFPLYYLLHFSRGKPEFGSELLTKLVYRVQLQL